MNATELHLPSGKPAGIYFCEKCRLVYKSHAIAEQCCQNYKCSICGIDTGSRHYLDCSSCRKAKKDAKERERFEKAEKLTEAEWKGWVYSEDVIGYNDGYFDSVDEVRDYCEDEEIEVPEYVWTCDEDRFVRATLDDITSRIEDNAFDDFDADDLHGLDELKKAIDVFNEANKDQVSFTPNYSKAVMLKKVTQ